MELRRAFIAEDRAAVDILNDEITAVLDRIGKSGSLARTTNTSSARTCPHE